MRFREFLGRKIWCGSPDNFKFQTQDAVLDTFTMNTVA